ncbi:hypothetical protein Glove_114g28 [Diversispora epigaea]|uniref:Uncharacterized protein n=1 Tax=Diversispora epigaea TaxID=1348612 RepID=A0A397J152_9GLOM|nr:hypothetical protein Glove_114g28 [Diversispora epigaea]
MSNNYSESFLIPIHSFKHLLNFAETLPTFAVQIFGICVNAAQHKLKICGTAWNQQYWILEKISIKSKITNILFLYIDPIPIKTEDIEILKSDESNNGRRPILSNNNVDRKVNIRIAIPTEIVAYFAAFSNASVNIAVLLNEMNNN